MFDAWHIIDTKKHPRDCGDCTMCCKLPAIPPTTFKNKPFEKSSFIWCEHCKVGIQCNVYKDRPTTCKTFECLYLVGFNQHRPNKLGFLAIPEGKNWMEQKTMTIYCEQHKLSSLIKNLKKEHNFNLMIKAGFSFVIRTNKDDEDLWVYDPKQREELIRPSKVEVKKIRDEFKGEGKRVSLEF